MQGPPPFGVEGVTRGLSGTPAPLTGDEDQALRRAQDADDLALQGLADAPRAAASPAPHGWRARLDRLLRRA